MNTAPTISAPSHSALSNFTIRVADDGVDSQWDDFLEHLAAGHHVQTSLWSRIKGFSAWQTKRVVVFRGSQVVGGAQMLIRSVRFLGKVGYVAKGPVLPAGDAELTASIIEQLLEIATASRVKVLFVQPPNDGAELMRRLPSWGFRACPIETAPTATVLVDLTADLATILSRMTKGMRNGIRRGQKNGISVREGSREDLPTFHRLLQATSKRRGFAPFELDYFLSMWDILQPRGFIKLFLSEYRGESVSAQLVIPFGDSVVAKQIGWSGDYGRLRPNEALDWATIKWCKSNGYKYYDLEGIEPAAAEALLNNLPLPEEYADSPTAYKLRLGGNVKLFPPAVCYISNPLLRAAYHRFGPTIVSWPIFQNAVSRFRTS